MSLIGSTEMSFIGRRAMRSSRRLCVLSSMDHLLDPHISNRTTVEKGVPHVGYQHAR